jgi:hypothetical protein
MSSRTGSRSRNRNKPSEYVFSNLLLDCIQQKEQGDLEFKNFKYQKALRLYEISITCMYDFEDYCLDNGMDQETCKVVKEFINELENKISVVNRILNKTKEKSIAKIQKQEQNLNDTELMIRIMLNEKLYGEALKFLNISPTINRLIEDNIFNNSNLHDERKIVILSDDKISNISNLSSSRTIDFIQKCIDDFKLYIHYLFKTSKSRNYLDQVRKDLYDNIYDRIINYLKKSKFKKYKNVYFIFSENNINIEEINSELNNIVRGYLSEILMDLPNKECLLQKLNKEFFQIGYRKKYQKYVFE